PDRFGDLPVIGRPPLDFRLATEDVARHLVAEVIVDQLLAAFLCLVAQPDVLVGESTVNHFAHRVSDLELFPCHQAALLDLDRSANQCVTVHGDVGTDLAQERALTGADRVSAHDAVGHDATATANNPAADGPVSRQRVDVEGVATLTDRLRLAHLLLLTLQLALDAATARRVPACGGQLECATVAEAEE